MTPEVPEYLLAFAGMIPTLHALGVHAARWRQRRSKQEGVAGASAAPPAHTDLVVVTGLLKALPAGVVVHCRTTGGLQLTMWRRPVPGDPAAGHAAYQLW
ncbi:hypothetical protein ACFWWS_25615 [Streptomyces sp. NPDC059083]|uniref:hypothetical protein n=1 Tax=unclassified Streptomyces TaxID=2593676 RepID=UPI0036CD78C7